MDKKKFVLLTIAGVVILGLIILIFVIKNNTETPDNNIDGVNTVNKKEVIKDQTVGTLLFNDVSLIVINGETNFYATVTNKGKTDYQINNLFVNFQDTDIDYKILALSNIKLSPESSTEIRLMIDGDLSNVQSVKYLLENAK